MIERAVDLLEEALKIVDGHGELLAGIHIVNAINSLNHIDSATETAASSEASAQV